MTTVEAAQRWAEAKDKLGAAVAAMDLAVAAHDEALAAEREAWDELEALAGRVPAPAVPAPMTCFTTEAGHFDASGHAVPPSMPRARMNGGVIERE